MLAFGFIGFLSLYALQRLQAALPLDPQSFGGVAPGLAFDTAISFFARRNTSARRSRRAR
jgi:K+-transporting ATPase ATPase A chain